MMDQRKFPRNASLSECLVERLFSQEPSVPSRVVNYSAHGLGIEIDFSVMPGDALVVQFAPDSLEKMTFGSDNRIAMVRWCSPQNGATGRYSAGVELALRGAERRR